MSDKDVKIKVEKDAPKLTPVIRNQERFDCQTLENLPHLAEREMSVIRNQESPTHIHGDFSGLTREKSAEELSESERLYKESIARFEARAKNEPKVIAQNSVKPEIEKKTFGTETISDTQREMEKKIHDSRLDKFRMSFIEPWEEEEAIKLVEDTLGFQRPRVCGPKVVVKIYTKPSDYHSFTDESGQKKMLFLPEQYSVNDKYRTVVGLVLATGPEAYTGWRFEESIAMKIWRFFFGKWMKPSSKKPRCKVGDWVVFPGNEGGQLNFKKLPIRVIDDDKVWMVIENPEDITRD